MKKTFFVLVCFFLFACSKSDYTIQFKDELVIDYLSGDSTCGLVDSIGNTKIEEKMIKDNSIKVGNYVLECPKLSTDKLGTYTIIYKNNQTEDREAKIQVKVQDISAPKITLKETEITLYEDEVDSFNTYDSELIKVSDKADSSPSVNVEGDTLKSKKGTYKLIIVAKDKSGNESKKTLTIIVKEREKKEKEAVKEETANNNSNEVNGNSSNVQNNTNNTVPTPNQTPPAMDTSIVERSYMFGDVDTLTKQLIDKNNATSFCTRDLIKSGRHGVCSPIQDSLEPSIFIGVQLLFQ